MKSILQDDPTLCFICGTATALETHHCFGGGLRKKSDKLGLTVRLCHNCHNEPPYGVHHCAEAMQVLKAYSQKKAMEYYNWTLHQWMQEFYKNYRED